jgi:hypothetical protein
VNQELFEALGSSNQGKKPLSYQNQIGRDLVSKNFSCLHPMRSKGAFQFQFCKVIDIGGRQKNEIFFVLLATQTYYMGMMLAISPQELLSSIFFCTLIS